MSVFDVGSPAAMFAAVAASAAMKFAAGVLLRKPKEYRLVGQVGELWIFPIKSLRGIRIEEAEIGSLGLVSNGVGDRQFVVTNEAGKFMCQRRFPTMVLIQPVLKGDEIELQAPGMEPIRFPCNPKLTPSNLSKATVFGDTVPSLDMGDEVSEWLSKFLNKQGVRLHFSESSLEKRDSSTPKLPWKNPAVKGDLFNFADYCAYLMLSQESVNFLNTKLDNPVPITNFRPNIIVHGCEAFAEDSWAGVKIGDARLRSLGLCTRCVLPTVNQELGAKAKDGEPLKTLKKIRLQEPYGTSPVFGNNFASDKNGLIRVGDPIYGMEA